MSGKHPFLFICYVSGDLCYFILADQFIKFRICLFFVKSKDFLYEFWWIFSTRCNSSCIIDFKILPFNCSMLLLSLSGKTWLICIRFCNNSLPARCNNERGLWQRKSVTMKRVWAWNMERNVLEWVKRITKSGGDFESYVASTDVSWTTLLYYLGEWLWQWSGGCIAMLWYMQDYVNSLVALGTQHFSSP